MRLPCRGLLAALWLLAWPCGALAACAPGVADLRGPWGQARFAVEIADDAAERAQGLMHRESLAPMAGMLFYYPSPRQVSFWMRNTLISLDMLFIDEAGVVRRIHDRAQPLDETAIDGGPGVLAVLEINGGMAERLGITVGSELRHPGLDQSAAAWPC